MFVQSIRFRTICLGAGLILACIAGNASSQQTPTRLDADKAVLEALGQSSDQESFDRLRQLIAPHVKRDPTKLYAFLPKMPAEEAASPAQPPPAVLKYCDALYSLAAELASDGQEGLAYQLLHEILALDSGHEKCRKILTPTLADIYRASAEPPKVTRMRKAERTYGWAANRWYRVDSAHFTIVSDADPEELTPLIEQLERVYAVWDQVFFEYWSSAGKLTAAFERGEPFSRRTNRKHSVAVFKSVEDYRNRLAGLAPNIEISKGYYAVKRRQSLFYLGEQVQKSWYHETAHQLFQERFAARTKVGDRSNFWLVEGIAMLFESLDVQPTHATLGGMFSERLQFARFNLFSRKFLRPVETLVQMTQAEFQQDPDVRQLYSQSAGVAQWLLFTNDGKHRPLAMQLLRLVYQAKDRPDSLLTLLDMTPDDINRDYIEFLRPQKLILTNFPPRGHVEGLCLAYGDIDDDALSALSQLESLGWLDLNGVNLEGDGLKFLEEIAGIQQLFVNETGITDDALTSIAKLLDLRELDLSSTQVTSTGLGKLSQLSRLEVLSISNTKIDDRAVALLVRLPALTSVDASNSEMSDNAKNQLRRKLDSVD